MECPQFAHSMYTQHCVIGGARAVEHGTPTPPPNIPFINLDGDRKQLVRDLAVIAAYGRLPMVTGGEWAAWVGGSAIDSWRPLKRLHRHQAMSTQPRLLAPQGRQVQVPASKSRIRFLTAGHGISVFWTLVPCSGEVSWSLNQVSIVARS